MSESTAKNTIPERNDQGKFKKGKLFTLMVAHFFSDGYAGFLAPILPLVILNLHLSLTSASFLVSVLTFSSALLQPLFGYLSDRMSRSYFVVLGPLLSALFLGAMGLADNYFFLLFCLFLGGMGVSCFHPQGTALAGEAGGTRRGLALSLFIGAGTVGYALGPLLIVYLVSAVGLKNTWFSAIPGVVVALLIYTLTSSEKTHSRPSERTSLRASLLPKWRPMALLMTIVIITSINRLGFLSFVPIFLGKHGQSLVMGGWAVTIYVAFGAIGATLGGPLSDCWGRKRTIMLVIFASVPTGYAYILTGGLGWLSLTFLALSGAATMASNTALVAMSQEMLPENPGVASSLVMGLGWGIAGIALTLAGNLADALGITITLIILSFVPLLSVFFCMAIIEEEKAQPRQTLGTVQPTLSTKEGSRKI